MSQRRQVERTEGIEALRVYFGSAVAAHQAALEKYAHLRHHGVPHLVACCSYLDARQQIFLAIGAQLPYRQLRTGNDDGLAQIFEHIAQGRRSVGHGVGAMQQHKTVIMVVMVGYDVRHFYPIARLHIARVNRRVKGQGIDVVIELAEFGHMELELFKIKVLQRTCFGIFNHTDGAARVYNEYVWCARIIHNAAKIRKKHRKAPIISVRR
ncbi:unknown [Prevotella sp. CAG:5226]|nr:unknown [Prevotella sp. CAG:5226]